MFIPSDYAPQVSARHCVSEAPCNLPVKARSSLTAHPAALGPMPAMPSFPNHLQPGVGTPPPGFKPGSAALSKSPLQTSVPSSVTRGRRTPPELDEDRQAHTGSMCGRENHRTWKRDPGKSERDAPRSRPFVSETSEAPRGKRPAQGHTVGRRRSEDRSPEPVYFLPRHW